MITEKVRLQQARDPNTPWKKWGPYLSERQWGTVREDYSANGDAWNYFPHDQARSRAYRWGEDGLGGISDDHQVLCFALALWNGNDPILKERLFGLNNSEGNHGEDVKEYYFYLESTPTHSYMKYLYKYPQAAYPYEDLIVTNRNRSREELEYELLDTGIFDEDRYFDVFVEYAKADIEDMLIKISIARKRPLCTSCRHSGSAIPGLGRTAAVNRCCKSWRMPNAASCMPIIPIRCFRRSWTTTISTATATFLCYLPRMKPTMLASLPERMPVPTLRTASITIWFTGNRLPSIRLRWGQKCPLTIN